MSVLKAACPSCGAPIEFQKGSTVVLICPFCRSAVARTDRGLDDLGKAAEIVDSQSPLKMGLRGEFNGNRFELTGRAQLKHELGGVWDEWYAVFSNGWVGWLAEAQGRFYLTFHNPLPPEPKLPPFVFLQLNQTVAQIPNDVPLIVTEKGTAKYSSAEGEIPFKLNPGEPKNFADLSGRNNAFATIDYSQNPPRVFVGRQVTLKEIGLGDAKPNVRQAQTVAVGKMGCPNCGGSLELAAPDKTERVTCPFCNSLLDVNQGNLKFLKSLGNKNQFTFELPIGAKGAFEDFLGGAEWQIIGAMVRSVTYDGTKYYWREYLLYNPLIGFRWLTETDGHWNFVEPVIVSETDFSKSVSGENVSRSGAAGEDSAAVRDKFFHLFQTAPATVEFVQGEFYWRVEQGETVNSADYVAPPFMLSVESNAKEMNWSLGTYVERAAVKKAFNAPELPFSHIIAPNQPFQQNSLIRASLLVLAAFILIAAVVSVLQPASEPADGTEQNFSLAPQASADAQTVVYTSPFHLAKDHTTYVSISSDLNYETWSEFSADLVPANAAENKNDPAQVKAEPTSSTREFFSQSKTFDNETSGDYQLRLAGKWKEWQSPLNLKIRVSQYRFKQGVPFTFLIFVTLIAVPIVLLIYKYSFESNRWGRTDIPKPSGGTFSGIVSGD